MKEEHIKNLIQKYKSGTTSLEQEKTLFETTDIPDNSIKKVSSFVKNSKKEVPENFNEKLWDSFEGKTKKSNKFNYGWLSVAASIVLIITLYMYSNKETEMTIAEKEALLNEAKAMFENEKQEENYKIILENELVIVYSKIQ
ncbi:hypothetical protein [Polaribacter porphyrae]|uniref:Uncharacterized protein n=1 Tax=Polaribacter porphyrae TaxID=1137780 RepID=A0A2S7WRM6_9FLAO|nr:hypothetical protein [Polaribacter porphyrae]PQJ80257.1 hypothetical protein BTO18_14190 [Polaribacter porphyrae]